MTPANILIAWNRKLLEDYSTRTVAALRAALPLKIAVPPLESFLMENVGKEVRKDALLITAIASAVAAGETVGEPLFARHLQAQREIDRNFLTRIGRLPAQIVIRFEELEPVRRQRMVLMASAVERILQAWRPGTSPRAAMQLVFTRADLEALVYETMRLYAQETRLLSRSLRLPALLVPLREKLAQSLYSVMNDAARAAARRVAAVVYRRQRISPYP